METTPASIQLSQMVRAARFFSREEAEALAGAAREAGVVVMVAENRRLPQGFDASLGGFDAAEGVSVFVRPEDVRPLRQALAEAAEVQPGDPLEALSNGELQAIVRQPLRANLLEQALALKILGTRGGSLEPVSAEPAAGAADPDPHARSDARLARWIGGLAVLLPLLLTVTSLALSVDGWQASVLEPAIYIHTGVSGTLTADDSFAGPLRVFLFVLAPLAAGAALVFSKRRLPDGSVRRMFSPGWRRIGSASLIISLLFYLIPLGYLLYWSIRQSVSPEPVEEPEERPALTLTDDGCGRTRLLPGVEVVISRRV